METVAVTHSSRLAQRPSVRTSLVDVTNTLATSAQLPCRVLFKNEFEQPSGSFKLRGIGYLVQQSISRALQQGATKIHVFASSGGNAGLAAAYSSQFYSVPCTVVVPTCTMAHVVEKLQQFGATVVLHGKSIRDADTRARQLMASADDDVRPIYCHPFDNPTIWEGHAEIMEEVFDELAEQLSNVRAVVCSVGGGGLYNGIVQGLQQQQSHAECVVVETTQAPSLARAVQAGSVVTLSEVKSVATSLACSYVSQQTLDNVLYGPNRTHLVPLDDVEAVKGTLAYHRDFGQPVEPACGAALAVVYNQLHALKAAMPDLTKDDIVVVVVCGGSCTQEQDLDRLRQMARPARL